jgi:hypothetical protein
MMAPVVARYYAQYLTGGHAHPFFGSWRPGRFAEGVTEREDLNIG